jgi:hypothetical protein
MICRNCVHPFIGKNDSDKRMAKHGYSSCGAARSAEEKARYVRGETECVYPERAKAK